MSNKTKGRKNTQRKNTQRRSALSFHLDGSLDYDHVLQLNPWEKVKQLQEGEEGQLQRMMEDIRSMITQKEGAKKKLKTTKKSVTPSSMKDVIPSVQKDDTMKETTQCCKRSPESNQNKKTTPESSQYNNINGSIKKKTINTDLPKVINVTKTKLQTSTPKRSSVTATKISPVKKRISKNVSKINSKADVKCNEDVEADIMWKNLKRNAKEECAKSLDKSETPQPKTEIQSARKEKHIKSRKMMRAIREVSHDVDAVKRKIRRIRDDFESNESSDSGSSDSTDSSCSSRSSYSSYSSYSDSSSDFSDSHSNTYEFCSHCRCSK